MDKEIVFINNSLLGYYKDSSFKMYSKEERMELLKNLEKEVIRKDGLRRLSSIIIASFLAVLFIIMTILMIFKVISFGESQWIYYIFILAFYVLVWVILYYLAGLVFYRKIKISFIFRKNNEAVYFNSSGYGKFVNFYQQYIGPDKLTTPLGKASLSLKMVKPLETLIFNGKIASNVPYFYISEKGERLLFLPGFAMYVNGKKSKVIPNDLLEVTREKAKITLSYENRVIKEFILDENFNNNFFNLKFE